MIKHDGIYEIFKNPYNVWNMFKANYKDTRTTPLFSLDNFKGPLAYTIETII